MSKDAPLPLPGELETEALVAMGWPKPLPKSVLWAYGETKRALDALYPARIPAPCLALVSTLARLAETVAPQS